MIAAVILAAGRSSRMGRPKALLPHRDGTTPFVRHAITETQSAGVEIVVVVGRGGDFELEREVVACDARFIVNSHPERGQLSSLHAALDAVGRNEPAVDAVLVMPVDVPLVTAQVLRTVIAASQATTLPIVRAVYRGVHGHPVLFRTELFGELRAADPSVGARAVVRADPNRVFDVKVDDVSITADVDTPEDYERVIGRKLT